MTDLSRFIDAHKRDFNTALSEIKNGRKKTHWMWYIFPQVCGLGLSPTAQFYGIKDLGEARAYLANDYLAGNMASICNALLTLETDDAVWVFGSIDAKKLRSSMTLFSCVCEDVNVYDTVLNKFFDGKKDKRTLEILGL